VSPVTQTNSFSERIDETPVKLFFSRSAGGPTLL